MGDGKYITSYYMDKQISEYMDIFNILSVEGRRSMVCVMMFLSITGNDPIPIIFLRSLKSKYMNLDIVIKTVLDKHDSYKDVINITKSDFIDKLETDYKKGNTCEELRDAIKTINYFDNSTDDFDKISDMYKIRFISVITSNFMRTGKYESYLLMKYAEKYFLAKGIYSDVSKVIQKAILYRKNEPSSIC
ncbi:hypothetical protein pepv_023 [Penguinpox virus]|uniref:Uncharacterized protein n=1 Tax=Penguinpox virus TaxID=648998 RepID=A0A068EEN7_9POXV|nr:hypothetical protein HM90_gp023 [Penguinpox virus]AID46764.1 hypothetical protein pepv_023 [Penguinpox virus]